MNNDEIQEKTLYVTSDGRRHDSRAEAVAHLQWLELMQGFRNLFPLGSGAPAWDLMKDMSEKPDEYIALLTKYSQHRRGGGS